jgi:hypothetical protein
LTKLMSLKLLCAYCGAVCLVVPYGTKWLHYSCVAYLGCFRV